MISIREENYTVARERWAGRPSKIVYVKYLKKNKATKRVHASAAWRRRRMLWLPRRDSSRERNFRAYDTHLIILLLLYDNIQTTSDSTWHIHDEKSRWTAVRIVRVGKTRPSHTTMVMYNSNNNDNLVYNIMTGSVWFVPVFSSSIIFIIPNGRSSVDNNQIHTVYTDLVQTTTTTYYFTYFQPP